MQSVVLSIIYHSNKLEAGEEIVWVYRETHHTAVVPMTEEIVMDKKI